jgi:hypothetical protein
VIKFLRMLTFLPLNEIDALEQAMTKPDYVPNTAQKRLAEAVTRYMDHVWQPLHTACDSRLCTAQQQYRSGCCVLPRGILWL